MIKKPPKHIQAVSFCTLNKAVSFKGYLLTLQMFKDTLQLISEKLPNLIKLYIDTFIIDDVYDFTYLRAYNKKRDLISL